MKRLFVFSALCLLVGCTDPASTNRSLTDLQDKLDQLQTQQDKFLSAYVEERGQTFNANLYWLADYDRDGTTVAYMYSARPIQTGEYIYIGDDAWRVEIVGIAAEEKPQKNDKPLPGKLYSVTNIKLAVKFQGKARKTPSPPVSASPTPQ
jgi:hypothetical protein